jgi:hypothetical protein
MDPTIVSVPVLVGIGGLAAAFTEFIKRTIIDKHIYQPTDPAHDTFVRGVCFVVALALTVLSIVPLFPGTGVGWLTLLFQAAASAGISISGYHIVTGSASPTPIAGTLVAGEAMTPPIDYAALAAALEPALARFAPGLIAPVPEHVILPASATLPPAVAPQSPPPEPAAPAAPPA